jgi:hypothetical protein
MIDMVDTRLKQVLDAAAKRQNLFSAHHRLFLRLRAFIREVFDTRRQEARAESLLFLVEAHYILSI